MYRPLGFRWLADRVQVRLLVRRELPGQVLRVRRERPVVWVGWADWVFSAALLWSPVVSVWWLRVVVAGILDQAGLAELVVILAELVAREVREAIPVEPAVAVEQEAEPLLQ